MTQSEKIKLVDRELNKENPGTLLAKFLYLRDLSSIRILENRVKSGTLASLICRVDRAAFENMYLDIIAQGATLTTH